MALSASPAPDRRGGRRRARLRGAGAAPAPLLALDVVAGFTVTISAARRDVGIGGGLP
jgi:hypothetical protein